MGYYFDDRDSAAWSYGDDAGRIIDLLGTRFMGENPVTPFIWRTFDESGILCNTLMQAINMSGGFDKVPIYIYNLYKKLADANDKARELERKL